MRCRSSAPSRTSLHLDGSSVSRPGGLSTHNTTAHLTDVDGTLFFSADDGTSGKELWKAGIPKRKSLTLGAKPKRVDKGQRTRLTAKLDGCPAYQGHKIRFQRKTPLGWKTFATKKASSVCKARVKPKITRKTVFRAKSPKQGVDHLAGTSNKVRVRLKS